jgi:predicted MFS family arabinose efflux permease
MIVVPALITGTGHGLMFHTMTSITVESFPSEVRGTGSALALMMLDFGTIAGAPVLGQIADRFGFDWMFTAIGAFALLVAGVFAYASIPVWQQRRELRLSESTVTAHVATDETAA